MFEFRDFAFRGRRAAGRPTFCGVNQSPFLAERAPKYVQVREYVRDLIGSAMPGSPAPSERELVNIFAVARMTVRQAIDALVAEGLLERRPGRGTFVAPRHRGTPRAVSGLTEYMRLRGVHVTSSTVMLRPQQAGPGVARALGVDEGTEVLHWRRVRFADGAPFGLEDVYLPHELVPGLTTDMPDSLYDYLGALGLRPTANDDSYTADVANDEDAQFLGVETGAPILRKQRRALVDQLPVEVSRSSWRTDQHALWLRFAD